ncbi:CRISPR-associated helicase Cas3' [Microbacterium sp.]|uniref:CRISPR-associated helicase Cas3' n=1 Tax=Microbacterium sp. TaxID=51671 RepID=UPI002D177D81|nr:CRISPR-associated helicase Cas3' [Microbacterium sp.]HWL78053.1 CRISPR-associated helicase Cas3' [Microbacterium sp.]
MTTTAPFWGKTHRDENGKVHAYDLRCHLLDTVGAALALWDLWLRPGLKDLLTDALSPGNPVKARAIAAAVAGLHDIGKANPVFQSQALSDRPLPDVLKAAVAAQQAAGLDMTVPAGVREDEKTAARHESVSQAILSQFPEETKEKVGDRWAGAVVGGHHGRYRPEVAGDCTHTKAALEALLDNGTWQQARQQIIDLVLEAAGVTLDDINQPLHAREGEAVILLSGFVIVADWVASDSLGLVLGHDSVAGGADAFAKRGAGKAYVKKAERAYRKLLPETIGVYKAPANPKLAIMGSTTLPLYPLQEAATTIGRGLWIVAETTGSGKTESAMLRHMNETGESVIWGLPTRATTDKMWSRIQWMYRRTKNVGALMHAHRSLNGYYLAKNTDGPGLRYSAWATEVLGNVKPLLSPVAVGTVDQVLLGALRQKWNPVRLLAIANAHVILDEVHLMDEYQVQLAEELLAWWGLTDTRVTMLSASLPTVLIQRFANAYNGQPIDIDPAYPAHTSIHQGAAVTTPLETAREFELDLDLRTFPYQHGEAPATTLVNRTTELALEAHREHPNARIAVIMNRVGHVQQITEQLLLAGIPDVTAMHSRMSAEHRTQLSRELETLAGKGARTEGCIVVGTQVIEASLDLDFDIIISELAPASALIQRAGRQWRHSKVTGGVWGDHWHARPTERPRLTVVSLREPDEHANRPSEALALPYAYGSLSRTAHALRKMRGTLAIPGGVQAFVDAAHYDFTEDDDTTLGTTDEILAAARRALAAHEVTIHARDRTGPFVGPLTYTKLAMLTHPDEQTETATRFTDYAQLPVLIVDQFATGRWAWRGTMDDDTIRRALATRHPREVAVLLGLTVQVPLDKVGNGMPLVPLIDVTKRFDRDETPFAASELRGVVPVRLSPTAHYDERLGLRI